MIHLLHLETSTKVCSVALSVNGQCVAIAESATDDYQHAEQLTVFIQNVLKSASLSLKDIHGVSVASGPGSYTGLRIGVSTAKGLCYALGIPLISVDSLYALAKNAFDKYPGKRICAMIDARRMEVFSAIYDENMEPIKSISADVLESDSYANYAPFVYVGDAVEKVIPLWDGSERCADVAIVCSAKGQVDLAYAKYQRREFEDVAYFEPFYLKDFVLNKKK